MSCINAVSRLLTNLSSGEHELYRQFIQLLMTHYTQEHEVSFYAKKCGVTPAHFSGAIRKSQRA